MEYNQSKSNCRDGCRAKACCLCITVPAQSQRLQSLPFVEGRACPCERVLVSIDHNPLLSAIADGCGFFHVQNPYPLSAGAHTVFVRSACSGCSACAVFCGTGCLPPAPPTIDTPANGAVIADPAPFITGRGTPGATIRVCIAGYGCQTAQVDLSGEYRVSFGVQLPDGVYTITATQLDSACGDSAAASSTFTVDTSVFLVEPIDARMGASFRTVDVDVLIEGAQGPATVYYLLLPPGSPAPTPSEIMNYQNTAALINGTAATGQFGTVITPAQTLYTWALTGLDNPNAPLGTTGVIDGYRYDVYLYVVFQSQASGVLTFQDAAMGMPYSSGLGTPSNPFTIRELTPGELQLYPDLIAGNPLNEPGVDETARMLENIERLITLYERTNGLYGLEDSMALNYLMISDIDLAGYAAAYGGEGWQSIGDIDGWINDQKETEHLFSGVFSGGGHVITNLSITPTATPDNFVGYRGLFGGVEEGTIKDLTLSGVTINAFATPPGQAQFGSFISIARNPTLSGLSLFNANIFADIGEIVVGDTHAVNIGGFVAEIFEGGRISNIVGQSINITVPSRSALALGGFVGFTDKFEAYESYENITLTNINITGYALIGGLAGYMVYGVNLVDNVTVSQAVLSAPGGETGGLIGRLYIYSETGDCLIEDSTVQSVTISLNGPGNPGEEIGGLIGKIQENPFSSANNPPPSRVFGEHVKKAAPLAAVWPMTTVQRCKVLSGQVNCRSSGGGLIGSVAINEEQAAGRVRVALCQARIPVTATASNAGGLIGVGQGVLVEQSFATGLASSSSSPSGGLIAFMAGSTATDCYAIGGANAGSISGGAIGAIDTSSILRSYAIGNVVAAGVAGGVAGASIGSLIQADLVLGGAISAPVAHRILGVNNAGSTLQNNYALNTVTPVPGVSDPGGVDGGTITSAQIVTTMQALGWNTATVWNTASVGTLGRPTLIQNPE